VVVRGFRWSPSAETAGTAMSLERAREQRDKLREIDDAQRRALNRSADYYLG
jgi:Spy/CpxP family protein refolding chaperone